MCIGDKKHCAKEVRRALEGAELFSRYGFYARRDSALDLAAAWMVMWAGVK